MIMKYNRKLILEDGQEYYGYAFGDTADSVCEIVFNTPQWSAIRKSCLIRPTPDRLS